MAGVQPLIPTNAAAGPTAAREGNNCPSTPPHSGVLGVGAPSSIHIEFATAPVCQLTSAHAESHNGLWSRLDP
eukprot:3482983-Lingulodinium_polyedra.AAC.1